MYGNRAQQTSRTTGTGAYELTGAIVGKQSLTAAIADTASRHPTVISGGSTGPWTSVRYLATDERGRWEIGTGTLTRGTGGDADTLTRSVIISSDGVGMAIAWGSGTRTITNALDADAFLDLLTTVDTALDSITALLATGPGITVAYVTLAELEADTDEDDGAIGAVWNDGDSTGLYLWDDSEAEWLPWGGDRFAALQALIDALEDRMTAAEADVADLQDATAALALATGRPNRWPDPGMRNAVSWNNRQFITLSRIGDIPAFSVANGAVSSKAISLDGFEGDVISWEFVYSKAAQAGQTVALRQLDGDGSIISAATTTVSLPDGAMTAEVERHYEIARHEDAVDLQLSIGSGSSGNAVIIGGITLTDGESAANRPSLRPITDAIDAFAEAATKPNLVQTTYALDPDSWAGSGSLEAVNVQGRTALKISGGSRSFTIPRGQFAGDVFSYSAIVEDCPATSGGSSRRLLLRQRTALNVTVGTDQLFNPNDTVYAGPQEWADRDVAFHEDCDHLLVFAEATTTGGAELTFSRLCITSGGSPAFRPSFSILPPKVDAYVDISGAGSDGNAGTYSAPFATIPAAISTLSGRGKIFVKGNGIIPGINAGAAVDLSIIALPEWRPKIRAGILVTGVTKTGGRDYVYEGALSASMADSAARYLYVEGLPEGPIPIAERHSYHRGQAYRSPIYRLHKVASLDLCDATEASFWWDSVALKAYVHLPGHLDATGYNIYRPGQSSIIYGGVKGQSGFLHVSGFDGFFGTIGADVRDFAGYDLADLNMNGAATDCYRYGGSNGHLDRCSGTSPWVDVFNAHGTVLPTPADDYRLHRMTGTALYGCFAGDDVQSDHEKCWSDITGLVAEYSGAGITPAAGAEFTGRDIVTRGNATWGLGCGTPLDADEGGVGTTANVTNFRAIDEVIGIHVRTGATNCVTGDWVATINCVTGAQADYGRIELRSWNDDGSATTAAASTNSGSLIVGVGGNVTPGSY